MKERIPKYITYIIGLPCIAFVSLLIFAPLTGGAHDGGFLGLAFGILIGQVLFSIWLIPMRWYYGFLIGFAWGLLSLIISFWIIRTILMTGTESMHAPSDRTILIMQFLFFIVLIALTIVFFEIVARMNRRSVDASDDV